MMFTAPEMQKRAKSHQLAQAMSLNGTNPHERNDSFAAKAESRAMLVE